MSKAIRVAVVTSVVAGLLAGSAFGQSATPAQTGPAAWAAMAPAALADAAANLSLQGDAAKDTRTQLAQYLQGAYLSDPAKTRTATPGQWSQYVGALAVDLTTDMKTQWAVALRAAFVPDQKTAAAMTDGDFGNLVQLLVRLGDGQTSGLWGWRVSGKLADPAAARISGLSKLTGWISNSGSTATADVKLQWALSLRAAFAPDQKTVAAMTDGDFWHLVQLLVRLGDGQTSGLWGWRVSGKLADPVSARAAGLGPIAALVNNAGSAATADVKLKWATSLRSSFAPDQKTTAALTEINFSSLVQLLDRLGESQSNDLRVWRVSGKLADPAAVRAAGLSKIVVWLNSAGSAATADVKTQWAATIRADFAPDEKAVAAMKESDFANLVQLLVRLGDPQPNDLRFWRISGKLEDPAMAQATGLPQIWQWMKGVNSAATADVRAAWITGLRGAFVGDVAAMGGLKVQDFVVLTNALETLGDKDTLNLTASWVAANNTWQTPDMNLLSPLNARLAKLGPTGRAARELMADYLTSLCTKQSAAAVGLGVVAWARLAGWLPKDSVADGKREALATALHAAFASDPATLGQLGSNDFQHLIEVLKRLGDPRPGELIKQWSKTSQAWAARDYAWILINAPSSGDGALSTQRQVIKEIESTLLASTQLMQTIPLASWSNIVSVVSPLLSADEKKSWATAIKTAFLPSDSSTLGKDDLQRLTGILGNLGDGQATELAKNWLTTNQNQFGSLAVGDVTAMISKVEASATNSQDVLPFVQSLDAASRAKLNNNQLALNDMAGMAMCWYGLRQLSQAQAWAMQMYNTALGSDQARATADQPTLLSVNTVCHAVRLLDQDVQEYPAFATVLVNLSQSGNLDELEGWAYYRNFGTMVKMPKSRQIVEAALTDASGNPRLVLAKILTWASRETDQNAQWRQTVEAKANADGLSADTKAMWLMVKGYVDAFRTSPNPTYRLGKPDLDAALATAQSDGVRVAAIGELTAYFINTESPDHGLTMIASLQGQFSQSKVLAGFKDRLERDRQNLKAQSEARTAAAAAVKAKVMLQYYQDCLAREQASGNTQTVASLQQSINNLKAQLGQQ